MAYTGFGDDNDQECVSGDSYSAARKTLGLQVGCKIVFGLSRVPFAAVEIVSEHGVRMKVTGRSESRGWTYFAAVAPSDDTVATYQLFGPSGHALEGPQGVHFDGPTSGTTSEGDQLPEAGLQARQTEACLAY